MEAMEHAAVEGTAVSPANTAPTLMVDVVFPEQMNHHGTLFGGAALALMDKLAFLVATRETRCPMVTASSGHIDFRRPIPQGRLVELSGRVLRRGRRSVEVQVDLTAEDLTSGIRETSATARFVLVSVDGPAAAGPAADDESFASLAGIGDISHMVEMVFPGHTNHHGTLFGGQALAWLGKAAMVAASRHCRMPVVMAASERVDFHAPVLEGEIADLAARVVAVGNSSMTVEVLMHAEALLTGQRRLCTRGRFTMVAIGYDGRPVPIARPRGRRLG
jgi:acyl-CoA hydrolase